MIASPKKRLGVVYTPEPIVNLILDNVLPSQPEGLADAVVCDPACGDGAFLTAIARRALTRLRRAEALAMLGRMTGYDIDRKAIALCRQRLDGVLADWYPGDRVEWKLQERSALDKSAFRNDFGRFTHVVGNPPYVRVQHLEQYGRNRIAGQWEVIRGATDLYLVFYELGLDLLRDGGVLGYISPSSWLRSDSGSALRRLLAAKHTVKKIMDFADHQVFDDATTYTVIAIIAKGGMCASIPAEKFNGWGFEDAGIISVDYANASAAWVASTGAEQDRMAELVERGPALSEVADIHVGIQTLADDVFILPLACHKLMNCNPDGYLPCNAAGETIRLESWILRDVVKASVMKDGQDPVSRVVIFPYARDGRLLPEERIAEEAPAAYEWLSLNKERLLNRDKGKFAPGKWYGFGRQVSIRSGFGEKILTSGMNRRPNFQRCPNPDATFYSGYCIKPKHPVDLTMLQDVLNSDDMDFFIRQTSRPYQGGWMSYAKSFIQDFPVPKSILNQRSDNA